MTCPGYNNRKPPPRWWPQYTVWGYLTKVWWHHPIGHTFVGIWRRIPHRPWWNLVGYSWGPADGPPEVSGVMKQCNLCAFIDNDDAP